MQPVGTLKAYEETTIKTNQTQGTINSKTFTMQDGSGDVTAVGVDSVNHTFRAPGVYIIQVEASYGPSNIPTETANRKVQVNVFSF